MAQGSMQQVCHLLMRTGGAWGIHALARGARPPLRTGRAGQEARCVLAKRPPSPRFLDASTGRGRLGTGPCAGSGFVRFRGGEALGSSQEKNEIR